MKRNVFAILLLVWVALFLSSCHAHVRNPSDIRPGMTKQDVKTAWGGTYLITYPHREGKEIEVWEYHFASTGSICRITFDQDRVIGTQCWRRAPWPWWYY